MTTWTKQPAIPGGSKGCLCCGAMHSALPLNSVIAVGFGSSHCTRDGELIYDENDIHHDAEYATCGDMEKLAAADPDHDWQIAFYAPLYEAVYQRHGDNHWVLIKKGDGFA